MNLTKEHRGVIIGALFSGFLIAACEAFIGINSRVMGEFAVKTRDFWWVLMIMGGAAGSVVGGIIGAAIGNQIGRGDGRRAATVAGALIGSAIGHDAGSRADNRYGYRDYDSRPVERCNVHYESSYEERIEGYNVVYVYGGARHTTRLPYDPGERIKVRVDVTPAEG